MKIVPSGWYYLGPAASNGSNDCVGVIVRETSYDKALAPIVDWEKVWDDSGSGKPTDYSLWRGVAQDLDFIVIGGFFVRSKNKPLSEDTAGMMAVHKDLVVDVWPGQQIWNDAGTGAIQDGAVWDISTKGNEHAVNTGAFVPVRGHDTPPHFTLALDSAKIITLVRSFGIIKSNY